MRWDPFTVMLLAVGWCNGLSAQPGLYDPGSVREFRLYFQEPRWRAMLDSLYLHGENARLTGDLVIDGTFLPGVGVRWKGYSSFSPGRTKNPFNIKLDHVHRSQHYQGYDKLKLANVVQDPSFVREALSYDIARQYMPVSLANYANVYVNDTLIGLYTNVEDVGKDFVEKHFGSRGNSFFKCDPDVVDLNGQNANLNDRFGTDSTRYYGLYAMQSDHGWGDLLELVRVLNHEPERVHEVLDVDRTLWMHAFNYAVINFDSYVGYAQNYYLYRDDDGLWNPILWDMDRSFASFRLTDASLYWNGFTINQAIGMDPLMHHHSVSVIPRPLMRNLFLDPMHRRMYLAHLRTIMEENFANREYYARARALRDLITPHVETDPNKFHSFQLYLDNLDRAVSDIVDFPGIAQLMDRRTTYLATYPGMSGQPVIGPPAHTPTGIDPGTLVTITAAVAGADTVVLAYRHGERGRFQRVAMLDDGAHGDGAAGDGVYGARITAVTGLVQFHIYAENATAGMFSPQRAAYENHELRTRVAPGNLVINEFMAHNTGIVVDGHGRASDWIELYNPGPLTISTAGLHLSDDPANTRKWALPMRTLAPGEFMVVWADGEPERGEEHANFRLKSSGESILLAYDDALVIDRVDFGPQYPVHSTGRLPNGTGPFRLLPPTFNAWNQLNTSTNVDRHILLYPNPATTELFVIVQESGPLDLHVFRSDGKVMTAAIERTTNELVRISTHGMSAGHYVLRIGTASGTHHQPFILIE